MEVKDEGSATRNSQSNRDQKPPIIRKGPNKSLEDDINKLFEAVNLRSSKSLDLSDVRRNASKKPMRGAGSHSPGIGFPDSVSLKQALRGLCISQAAEMAAMKRLSLPASPRVSEAGKIANMCRFVGVETGESSCSSVESEAQRIEITLIPEQSASCSSGTLLPSLNDSALTSTFRVPNLSPCFDVKAIGKTKQHKSRDSGHPLDECDDVGKSRVEKYTGVCSASTLPRKVQDSVALNQSACDSPLRPAAVVLVSAESNIAHNKVIPVSEVDIQKSGVGQMGKDCCSVSVLPHGDSHDNHLKQDLKISVSSKAVNVLCKEVPASLKVVEKAAPKVRRKSRLQSSSSVVKGKKDVNSMRSTSRAVKPVGRNKNLIIKKSKKVVIYTDGSLKGSSEVDAALNHSSEQEICQRCQCSLRHTSKDPLDSGGQPSTASRGHDANKLVSIPTGWVNKDTSVVKSIMVAKQAEKKNHRNHLNHLYK
ncbi:hypothetical protein SASPL_136046 [Salvia splendens]|uniref:Uncharacterized protein n=1 Tax=Salvia splendens TaxID=180675 RepID=A0A8X8ZGI6_SALSN|nr:hypothetical protein SASPL_136046 [Salvia splendens]